MTLDEKVENVKKILKEMGSLLIAFSGGVDSTFLLKMAFDCVGDHCIAVTATSETYSTHELAEARGYADSLGVRHMIIDSHELNITGFRENTPRRCYYCKRALFSELKEIARQEKVLWVADGANLDDVSDYRPGMQAARELGIRSPLQEAGFTKDDIRHVSRHMGLPTWDKPALACYASRFPYGTEITPGGLRQVGEAETFLRGQGMRIVRVRHHNHMARIEIGQGEMSRFFDPDFRTIVIEKFKGLGYVYIALDLEGYRTGSMNEVLDMENMIDH